MAEYIATIAWTRAGAPEDFIKGRYSREHTWTFDGGVTVPASPSPSVVPAPWSNPGCVDPEEAFVASISSCHMLTYLFIASRKGFEITRYEDDAVGHMTKNERGSFWVNSVVLAIMKIWTSGKHLWTRTIGSTIAGEAVDTLIFYPLAFMGDWKNEDLIAVMIANYLLKVGTEVVLTPFTYMVVNYLKRVENEDFYDVDTNFSPLPGQE